MKRILSILLCLAMLCGTAVTVYASDSTTAPLDATEVNTGPAAGNAFFIFTLVLLVLCVIYLIFKFRKS